MLSVFTLSLKVSIRVCPSNPPHMSMSFSLRELVATMNLNAETQKRRVCFNSCFDSEKLELVLPGQLALSVCLYIAPAFL